MSYTPQRGDIVHLGFDPSSRKETKGNRFGLVVSEKTFNALGFAVVCPITQGIGFDKRVLNFTVTLMGAGTDIQGMVLCHEFKSLDWGVRKAQFKENAPAFVVDEVLDKIETILFS